MDEEALVETLVSEGARLDAWLRTNGRGAATTPPVVAFDVEMGEWQVLFALPPNESRLHAYDRLQEAIHHLGLMLTIDRVVMVKPSDPGLQELLSGAPAFGTHPSKHHTPVEVAGRFFVDPRTVWIDPRTFERQVFESLQRIAPQDSRVLRDTELRMERRRSRDFYGTGTEPLPPNLPPDMALVSDEVTILVEAKSTRRPLSLNQALNSLGLLAYAQRTGWGRHLGGLILVSAAGFTAQCEAALGHIEDIALVNAMEPDLDMSLQNAVHRLFR